MHAPLYRSYGIHNSAISFKGNSIIFGTYQYPVFLHLYRPFFYQSEMDFNIECLRLKSNNKLNMNR